MEAASNLTLRALLAQVETLTGFNRNDPSFHIFINNRKGSSKIHIYPHEKPDSLTQYLSCEVIDYVLDYQKVTSKCFKVTLHTKLDIETFSEKEKRYKIEYYKKYRGIYIVKAENQKDACEKLENMIAAGLLAEPSECFDSGVFSVCDITETDIV